MKNPLQDELKTYENEKQELLSKSKGKFVLIKGNKVVGIFDSEMDAINQGYEKFGNTPFLVKQITEVEQPINFSSHELGI